jgi:VanZ family protein
VAWLLVIAILSLSLVPPSLRPVTGAPHDLEHFAIFALCGLAFGLGYSSRHLPCAISLVIFAGMVEVLQLAIPGRHARMVDFAVDALAGCAGVLIGWMALKRSLAEGI